MKNEQNKFLTRGSVLMSVFGLLALSMWVVSCSKDNKIEPISGGSSTGADVIDSRTGGTFNMDKTHSSVMWETVYYGDNALLTGRFNKFGLEVYFNEADPASSQINGWVQLSEYNTGEPGRDGYGKCGPGYMGVIFDTLTVSPLELIPRATTDTASFTSTAVSRYGDGYVATGNFTFRNVTKEVNFYFMYEGTHEYTTSSGMTTRAGLSGHFTILAKTDFGVTSSSIADEVKIMVNANYRKQ